MNLSRVWVVPGDGLMPPGACRLSPGAYQAAGRLGRHEQPRQPRLALAVQSGESRPTSYNPHERHRFRTKNAAFPCGAASFKGLQLQFMESPHCSCKPTRVLQAAAPGDAIVFTEALTVRSARRLSCNESHVLQLLQ